MDLRKLKTLIDLVSESNIAELEITENEGKVRIVKSGNAVYAAPMVGQPQYAPAPAPMAPAAHGRYLLRLVDPRRQAVRRSGLGGQGR
jgi:acetyl-CoA carboxylase biotin carboxyl carrier protein